MILTVTQEVALSVSFVDARGNPAVVDGAPVWASSDPAVVIVPTADPLTVIARAAGVVGTSQVSLTADADLGEGVREIIGTIDFQVVAGEAVAVTIQAGAPTEQVVPEPEPEPAPEPAPEPEPVPEPEPAPEPEPPVGG